MADIGLTEELVEAMKEFLTPKFMVTKDSLGEPNIVPVMFWTVYNDSTGYIELDRVYTCSLPRPGLRVDIPLLTPET